MRPAAPTRLGSFLAALATLFVASGCLRVREELHLRADGSGRAVLEVVAPRALLPSGPTATLLRLQAEDLQLPTGVSLARYDVRVEDSQAHCRLELEFVRFSDLTAVALRYPGTQGAHDIRPWEGVALERVGHRLELRRPALGASALGTAELDAAALGRLAGEAVRLSTVLHLDESEGLRWVDPEQAWVGRRERGASTWSRTRTWREALAESERTNLLGLVPLPLGERLVRIAGAAFLGLLQALPFGLLATLLLARRRQRRAELVRRGFAARPS